MKGSVSSTKQKENKMTDKEQIKCKYKFQDKEKFDGKTYCTCFCELCEDLPLCDDNCQIYEDFKQLARKTQELYFARNEVHSKTEYIREQRDIIDKLKQEYEQLQEKYEALKLENEEGYEIVDGLKQECEELKKQLMQKDEINTFFNTQIEGWSSDPCGICEYKGEYTRYRKALEQIEEATKYLKKDLCGHCGWYGTDGCTPSGMVCEELIKILDIINKAKGEGKCQ